jgi:hypothetical protein
MKDGSIIAAPIAGATMPDRAAMALAFSQGNEN